MNKYPLTKNVIKDYYYNVSNQLDIIKRIKKWKIMYINPRFWLKPIEYQIICLKNLRNSFLSIYDGRIGTIYFHLRIKGSMETENITNEMISRLYQVYKLFKYNFFNKNNISMLLNSEFLDLAFVKRIEYMEYIFNTIKPILDYYILSYELYELYRTQLENLLNPVQPLNIDVFTVYSDIGTDDIDFIICN